MSYISKIAADGGKNRKRVRGLENFDLDQCVLKWLVNQARDKIIPLSGTMLCAKAEEFGASLWKNNFKASTAARRF